MISTKIRESTSVCKHGAIDKMNELALLENCSGCDCMGWLRLVGSSKLQVSFAKEPYKRDHLVGAYRRIHSFVRVPNVVPTAYKYMCINAHTLYIHTYVGELSHTGQQHLTLSCTQNIDLELFFFS